MPPVIAFGFLSFFKVFATIKCLAGPSGSMSPKAFRILIFIATSDGTVILQIFLVEENICTYSHIHAKYFTPAKCKTIESEAESHEREEKEKN